MIVVKNVTFVAVCDCRHLKSWTILNIDLTCSDCDKAQLVFTVFLDKLTDKHQR